MNTTTIKQTVAGALVGASLVGTGMFINDTTTGTPQEIMQTKIESVNKEMPDMVDDTAFLKEQLKTKDLSVYGESNKLRLAGRLQEIDGGIWFNTSIGLPPCDKENRGVLWFSASKDGAPDQWLGCMKDDKDVYDWQVIR